MFQIDSLSVLQKDAMKEIGNIGAGHAATALAQLLSEKIEMTVPHISIVPLNHVSEILGGAEELVVGIYMKMFGDAPGKLIFLFHHTEAVTLVNVVTGSKCQSIDDFEELEQSALEEISNIMTGAYLNAMTKLTGFNLISSVPAFACDMAGAILNSALLDLGMLGDNALLIKTEFSMVERKINGHFFLIPDPGSMEAMLSSLGV